MALYTCSACAATNTQSGDCVACGAELGSVSRATLAAFGAAGALAFVWVALALGLGLQTSWFGLLYGGLVSGALVHFSGGRGLRYQAIATTATIGGLLVAETALVAALWRRLEPEVSLPPWDVLAKHQLEHDPITVAFLVLGVMGGMWVWRYPIDEEE